MRPEPIQTFKSEATPQERGATINSLERTEAKPVLPHERDMCLATVGDPTPVISTAVERKDDTGKSERKSIKREHTVREQVRRRQSATPNRLTNLGGVTRSSEGERRIRAPHRRRSERWIAALSTG